MKTTQKSKRKLKLVKHLALLIAPMFFVACFNDKKEEAENAAEIPVNQEMIAELTAPPHVPTPVGTRKAKKLIVKMEILEEEGEMTDGVKYVY